MAWSKAAAFVSVGFASALWATAAFSQTVLNFNSQVLENSVPGQVEKWFVDEINERTDGEVQIRIFFGEGLGRATETLSLMADGAVDMASMSAGFYPAELPLTAAPNSIPMALDDVAQAMELMQRILEEVPAVREEHETGGIRALFFHNLNPYYLISTTPITALADLNGKRMRTWGSDMPRLATAAGAIPITIGTAELYESLSRGALDVAPFSFDYIKDLRLYEVARHITMVPAFVGPTGGVWISETAWASLSEEHRDIILGVSGEALRMDYEMVTGVADEARQYLEEQGVTMHPFPEDDEAAWQEANPDFFNDFIERMEPLGKGDAAREIVRLYGEVRGLN